MEPAPPIWLRTADGAIAQSNAKKIVALKTKEACHIIIRFRLAEVTQPILSVAKLSETGKEVALGNGCGHITRRGPGRLKLACQASMCYLMATSGDDVEGGLAPSRRSRTRLRATRTTTSSSRRMTP